MLVLYTVLAFNQTSLDADNVMCIDCCGYSPRAQACTMYYIPMPASVALFKVTVLWVVLHTSDLYRSASFKLHNLSDAFNAFNGMFVFCVDARKQQSKTHLPKVLAQL